MIIYFLNLLVLALIFFLAYQVVRVVLSNRYHKIRLKRAEEQKAVEQIKEAEGKRKIRLKEECRAF